MQRQSVSHSYGVSDTSRPRLRDAVSHRMRLASPAPTKPKDYTMTMLTPAHGQFERTIYSSGSGNRIEAGRAGVRLAKLKRFCISALWVALACVALTAIMALKVIVYLPHFHA
jgi:hypothetical protein